MRIARCGRVSHPFANYQSQGIRLDSSTSAIFAKNFAALLFDMDGTLLNSMAVVEKVWTAWAARFGIDREDLLKTAHGVRAVDIIRGLGLPVDPEREARALAEAEIADVDGVVEIPGAVAFLNTLPPERWAIVTSAPLALARRRLAAAGIPMPQLMITGEDVSRGKPDPQGYLLAAERLGVRAADCLVFEDAPAGVLAGIAAGAQVAVVTGAHAVGRGAADVTLEHYSDVEARIGEDGWLSLHRRYR